MGTMHAKVQVLLNQASIPSLVKVQRIGHEWWATHFEKQTKARDGQHFRCLMGNGNTSAVGLTDLGLLFVQQHIPQLFIRTISLLREYSIMIGVMHASTGRENLVQEWQSYHFCGDSFDGTVNNFMTDHKIQILRQALRLSLKSSFFMLSLANLVETSILFCDG